MFLFTQWWRINNFVETYMCVGATKGTYRRDSKMIVNHDYIKQCIIFAKKFLADYTSKCLLSIQLTPISAVLCVHVASSVFFA